MLSGSPQRRFPPAGSMLRRAGCFFLLSLAAQVQSQESAAERLSPCFGTKSRYETSNPRLLQDPLSLGPPQPGFPLQPASCTPLQIVTVIRHGTRFPTGGQIKKLAQLHGLVVRRNGTCPASEALAHWDMWYRQSMDGHLAERGRYDMLMLARRLAARFPGPLAPQRRFVFTSSHKPRCVNSSEAFRDGLYQALYGQEQLTSGNNPAMLGEIKINDTLMRFFDLCEKFVRDVDNNNDAMHEVNDFKKSPEMKKVIERIADKLCLSVDQLNADLVQVGFFACSFELAIKNISSPWCSIFSETDALVLEYLNDLKQYWKRGYGYDINSRASCVLFQDIFRNLDQAVKESKNSMPISSPAVLQFGHAETLLPVLSVMGYFKDSEPLKANNYHKQMNRKFRSGRIVPYAANLVFVLYHCDQAPSPNEEYKIQILLNEKLLEFPWSGKTVISLDNLKKHYKDILQKCHFAEVCDVSQNTTAFF
ncbi:multiple inositol polyphosphate phosphatase 1 [Sphaerodactylus townsendi]|uniref:multiple inositol polyphosphate phosphatase 1 n=1 Tax=Sphaerodactylus townsendi TaxID=933632 RepID=UPI00202666F5|nr:multiple inositol polyphosphate phosphatase 1 [Sphaerodactylus townsendi]